MEWKEDQGEVGILHFLSQSIPPFFSSELRGDATKVLDQRKGETERDVDDVD
jgi:hypothetical protein